MPERFVDEAIKPVLVPGKTLPADANEPADGTTELPIDKRDKSRRLSQASAGMSAGSVTGQAPGEPILPGKFLWGNKTIEVVSVLRAWRETGPCHHGSDEMYVRKHWYEVATNFGILKIYFERQPRRGQAHKKDRWWLFSIRETDEGRGEAV